MRRRLSLLALVALVSLVALAASTAPSRAAEPVDEATESTPFDVPAFLRRYSERYPGVHLNLLEATSDVQAEELLRVRLGNKASKAASRVAAEGVVGVYVAADGKAGALVELNCETDFVAKNDDFLAFAQSLAEQAVRAKPADAAALAALEGVEARRQGLVHRLHPPRIVPQPAGIDRRHRVAAQGREGSEIHRSRRPHFEGQCGMDSSSHRRFQRWWQAAHPAQVGGVRLAVDRRRLAIHQQPPRRMLSRHGTDRVDRFGVQRLGRVETIKAATAHGDDLIDQNIAYRA